MAREEIPVGLRKGDKTADVELLNRYLSTFGYASPISPDGVDLHSSTAVVTNDFSDETERALHKFQRRHGLTETGETDSGTAALLNMPRCGVPDPDFHSRYVLGGPRWERTNLTFAISQFPGGGITNAQAQAALVAAFGAWAAVVPLTFNLVADTQAHDINVRFVVGDHGDGHPFDGPQGILAHAFYPPPGAFAGDVHFDNSERWALNIAVNQIDIQSVATHEIGHALGLAHSAVQGSVMFATYAAAVGSRALTNDDITAIRRLYAPVTRGSVLTGFSNVVHWSPDGLMLGSGRPLYDGSSPVVAMLPYANGVLTAFSNTGGYGHAIHFSPDGEGLGSGEMRYNGTSPVRAMVAYDGGVLTAFSQAGGAGHRVWFSKDGRNLGGGELRYEGTSPVQAMCAFGGGILTAFSQAGGAGHRVWFSKDGRNLGGGELCYEGTSPVHVMCGYGGGILTAFSEAGGYGHRVWFSPNGKNLGGGELCYDGTSPVLAMCTFGGGILTAFSQAGGFGYRVWFSPNGRNLGGGELRYDGSNPALALAVF